MSDNTATNGQVWPPLPGGPAADANPNPNPQQAVPQVPLFPEPVSFPQAAPATAAPGWGAPAFLAEPAAPTPEPVPAVSVVTVSPHASVPAHPDSVEIPPPPPLPATPPAASAWGIPSVGLAPLGDVPVLPPVAASPETIAEDLDFLSGLDSVDAVGSGDEPVLPPSAAAASVSTTEREDEDEGDLLDDYLRMVIELGGSDLHLSPGSQPRIRINGDLRPIEGTPVLTDERLRKMVLATLKSAQRTRFEQAHELNFSYKLPGEGRFRGNLMLRDGAYAAVYRMIPWKIKSLGELHMPPVLQEFAQLHRGLVLVTGATGSGKSTTLAAILDLANRTRDGHILTIEDPVEFVHPHQRCLVNQREVGPDTESFAEALRNALRQDPDIILVGEMRDLETIQVALTAAETGHLVFGTLHTISAKDTINRIIDAFPAGQQDQIRTQLASSLTAVLCQTLCKTIDGKGRVAATELMVTDTSIKNAIRESKIHQIPNAIQLGKERGMHTLTSKLAELVKAHKVGAVEASEKAYDRGELANALGMDKEQATPEGFARFQDNQHRRMGMPPGSRLI